MPACRSPTWPLRAGNPRRTTNDDRAIRIRAGTNILKPLRYGIARNELEAKFCPAFMVGAIALRRKAGIHEFNDEFVQSAPVQAMIIPITDKQADYADEVAQTLKAADIRVEVDRSRDRMQAKIRNAQLQKVPYMLVVGGREAEANAVAVRLRSGEDLGAMPVEDFLSLIEPVIATKSLDLQHDRETTT